MDIGLSSAGFGVGVLVGATGVGGGSLMTPLLIGLFGIPPLVAVGTDVVCAATIKLFAVILHGRFGTVHWRTVWWLALGSLPAALVSLLLISAIGPQTAVRWLAPILGVVLIATALSMLIIVKRPAEAATDPLAPPQHGKTAETIPRLLLVTLGAVIGTLVTWTSVGAGALGAAFLRWMIPSFSAARLVGTDLGHALMLSIVVGAGHWELGNVDYALWWNLTQGALPGIAVGSLLAFKLPDLMVRRVLAAAIGVVGIKWLLGT